MVQVGKLNGMVAVVCNERGGPLCRLLCQGLTGFGFALLSIPVLAGFMGMKEAVIVGSGLCFIHYGLLAARSYRDLSFKSNTGIIIGTFLGMSLGMYIFHHYR